MRFRRGDIVVKSNGAIYIEFIVYEMLREVVIVAKLQEYINEGAWPDNRFAMKKKDLWFLHGRHTLIERI